MALCQIIFPPVIRLQVSTPWSFPGCNVSVIYLPILPLKTRIHFPGDKALFSLSGKSRARQPASMATRWAVPLATFSTKWC